MLLSVLHSILGAGLLPLGAILARDYAWGEKAQQQGLLGPGALHTGGLSGLLKSTYHP